VGEDAAEVHGAATRFHAGEVEDERAPEEDVAELEDDVERALGEDVNAEVARDAVAADEREDDHVAEAVGDLVGEGVGGVVAGERADAGKQAGRFERPGF